MLTIRLRNFYLPRWDGVGGARLYLDPAFPVAPPVVNDQDAFTTASSNGDARLDISALQPGTHTLWVIPKFTSAERVGVQTMADPKAERMFRSLRLEFSVGGLNNVTSAVVHATTMGNGIVTATLGNTKNQILDVHLRAIWLKSPYNYQRTQKIDMIVVHKTGGPVIGPAINQMLVGGASAHYIIDRDGAVLKFVHEDRVAGHASHENAADQSHWGKQTTLAWRSIGIENVGSTKQGLEDAQYMSLIRIIQEMMAKYSIPRHRVIAHSDILTDGHGVLSDQRIACPGWQFEWSRLENAKGQAIGLSRAGGTPTADDVGAIFMVQGIAATLLGGKSMALVEGDYDPIMVGTKLKPGRFGRREIPDVAVAPIKLLQTWLSEIGYSVGKVDGIYHHQFARAVRHFRVHFLRQHDKESIDQETADLIRAVRAANPKAD